MKKAAVVLLLCWSASGLALGQDDIEAQRQSIAAARAQAQTEFAAQEAVCAKRFAVTACMEDVSARRRASNKALARQEAVLNNAERTQRAVEQRQRLDDKARERLARDAETQGNEDVEQDKLQQQRDKQAQHQAQAGQVSNRSAAAPKPSLAASAQTANQQAFADKQKAAQERKAAREKRLRESTKTQQSLPTPP